jgi:hypothetical protein
MHFQEMLIGRARPANETLNLMKLLHPATAGRSISTFFRAILVFPVTFLFCCNWNAAAQCVAPDMSFHSPELIAGTDNQIGAVYLFRDVMAGVDAQIKINDLVGGAVLNNIDDSTGPGYYDAFQPFVDAPANSTSYLEWAITFKKAGTNTDTILSCFAITGVDVDGNGVDLKEFIEAATPGSYALDPFTTLAFSFDGVRSKAVSDINVFLSIDTANRTAMFQMNFSNISTLIYRNGAISNHGSVMTRQTCIYFKSFFNNFTLLLPVKLLSFSGQATASGNQLSWSATDETDAAAYVLQKSSDGNNWQDLTSQIPGKFATNRYFVTDNDKASMLYYRVCILTRTGVKQFSKIVKLQRNSVTAASFLPGRFVAGGLSLTFSNPGADSYEFSLWTMNGQRISKQQLSVHAGNNSVMIDAGSNPAPGIYLLTVKNSRGELIHQAKLLRN